MSHNNEAPVTVRVELPVLLYADVDLRGNGNLYKEAQARIWKWLGRPGDEIGIDVECGDPRIHHARLYPFTSGEYAMPMEADSSGDFCIITEGLEAGLGICADIKAEKRGERCRVCGQRYTVAGDGWDGLCPSCGDKLDCHREEM